MDWLKTIAPTIASALGGPLAGMAVDLVSKACGIDAKDVHASISEGKLSADQIAFIKQAELQLQARAQELGLDFEKIAAADRDSARNREIAIATSEAVPWINKMVTPAIACSVVVVWGAVQYFLFHNIIPAEMRELTARVLGTLDGALMLVLSYYFGASQKN